MPSADIIVPAFLLANVSITVSGGDAVFWVLAGLFLLLPFVGWIGAYLGVRLLSRSASAEVVSRVGREADAEALTMDGSVMLPSPPPELSGAVAAYVASNGRFDDRAAKAAAIELVGAGVISAVNGKVAPTEGVLDETSLPGAMGASDYPLLRPEETSLLGTMGARIVPFLRSGESDPWTGPVALGVTIGRAAFRSGYITDEPVTDEPLAYRPRPSSDTPPSASSRPDSRCLLLVALVVLFFINQLVLFILIVGLGVRAGVRAGAYRGRRRRAAGPYPATDAGMRAVAMVDAFANSVEAAVASGAGHAELFGPGNRFPDVTPASGLAYLVAAGHDELAERLVTEGLSLGPDAGALDWQTLTEFAAIVTP